MNLKKYSGNLGTSSSKNSHNRFQNIVVQPPPINTCNTIDEKHTEMLNQFHLTETEEIPKLLEQVELLKTKISELKESEIDKYLDIRDKIRTIQMKMKTLKSAKNTYLLKNAKYIFQYFEEKKNISSGGEHANKNVLNSFFKIKGITTESSDISNEKYNQSKIVYQNYWKNVNNELINIQDFLLPTDICVACNRGELISQDEEGILICNNPECGKFITYIVDSAKPCNKEPPNEVSYTA